jgi:predicted ester cyclase
MTTNQTKQIALDHFDRLNAGDIAGASAQVIENLVDHSAIPEAQGRAGFVSTMTKLRTAFPDLSFKLEDVIVEGELAVLRVTTTGTQQGPLALMCMPCAASGKSVKFEQIHVLRVVDGKIVEHWLGQDSFAMLRQLGLQVTPAGSQVPAGS